MATTVDHYHQIEKLKETLDRPEYEPLTTKQQRALAIRANDLGDDQARNRLVTSVLRYNFELAKEISDSHRRGNIQDLYGRGLIHIIDSSYKYDPRYKTESNFLTFVKRLLKLKMIDFLQSDHSVAPAEKNKWTKYSVEVKDYDQDGYPIYRTEEKTFSELMQTTSIDASYNNEDLQNNLALIDQFSGVEDLYIKKEQKEFVFSILENDLTDVQRTVINATTDGILGDSVKIKDLQSIYGLTHEGIRKIGKRAEKKIKDKYGKNLSEALKSF